MKRHKNIILIVTISIPKLIHTKILWYQNQDYVQIIFNPNIQTDLCPFSIWICVFWLSVSNLINNSITIVGFELHVMYVHTLKHFLRIGQTKETLVIRKLISIGKENSLNYLNLNYVCLQDVCNYNCVFVLFFISDRVIAWWFLIYQRNLPVCVGIESIVICEWWGGERKWWRVWTLSYFLDEGFDFNERKIS